MDKLFVTTNQHIRSLHFDIWQLLKLCVCGWVRACCPCVAELHRRHVEIDIASCGRKSHTKGLACNLIMFQGLNRIRQSRNMCKAVFQTGALIASFAVLDPSLVFLFGYCKNSLVVWFKRDGSLRRGVFPLDIIRWMRKMHGVSQAASSSIFM
jgi:hypothetical protein